MQDYSSQPVNRFQTADTRSVACVALGSTLVAASVATLVLASAFGGSSLTFSPGLTVMAIAAAASASALTTPFLTATLIVGCVGVACLTYGMVRWSNCQIATLRDLLQQVRTPEVIETFETSDSTESNTSERSHSNSSGQGGEIDTPEVVTQSLSTSDSVPASGSGKGSRPPSYVPVPDFLSDRGDHLKAPQTEGARKKRRSRKVSKDTLSFQPREVQTDRGAKKKKRSVGASLSTQTGRMHVRSIIFKPSSDQATKAS